MRACDAGSHTGYFELTPEDSHREVRKMHAATQGVLHSKAVACQQIRSGLVPTAGHHEAALLFDSRRIDSSWYGLEFENAIPPLYHKRSTHTPGVRCRQWMMPLWRLSARNAGADDTHALADNSLPDGIFQRLSRLCATILPMRNQCCA